MKPLIPTALLLAIQIGSAQNPDSEGFTEHVILSNQLDRWNYPFNPTPGSRTKASVFRSEESDVGLLRHGNFVFGFDTQSLIPSSRPTESYNIQSISVKVMTTSQFETPYDPTYDPVHTYLPSSHPQAEEDKDPGRPLEIFGTGFRHGFTPLTWLESTPYSPSPGELPTAFPTLPGEEGEAMDATLGVDYQQPLDYLPLAIGTIEEGIPGDPIPENTWVRFHLDPTQPALRRYLQEGLARGKIWFTLTGLHSGGQGVRTFPEFHTSDSLTGEAPQLNLLLSIDTQSNPSVLPVTLQKMEEHWSLTVESPLPGELRPEKSTNLKTWAQVESPIWVSLPNNTYRWIDPMETSHQQFYRVIWLPQHPE